ncbi:threonylcarbamoyladenosine tRNA methylthiotransferase [Tanacetum coccineum]
MAGQLLAFGYVLYGSRDLKELEGVSIVGVQQIHRVVEVVEETLKGHEVRLLNRKTLPELDLPKVRKNEFVEILPINVGYLGACTYCKTKHARGHLRSYTVDSLSYRWQMATPVICVYWDLEMCCTTPKSIYRAAIEQIKSYDLGGFILVDAPAGMADASDIALIVDLYRFVLDHPPSSYIFLISDDGNFARVLATLRVLGYRVALIHPHQASPSLLVN